MLFCNFLPQRPSLSSFPSSLCASSRPPFPFLSTIPKNSQEFPRKGGKEECDARARGSTQWRRRRIPEFLPPLHRIPPPPFPFLSTLPKTQRSVDRGAMLWRSCWGENELFPFQFSCVHIFMCVWPTFLMGLLTADVMSSFSVLAQTVVCERKEFSSYSGNVTQTWYLVVLVITCQKFEHRFYLWSPLHLDCCLG